jgi:quinol monooxygenase YgiN
VITCTTILNVKEENTQHFERLLTALVNDVLASEPGTTLFQLVRSQTEPLTYLVIEQYIDKDAMEDHSQTDYLKATVPEMLTYLTQPPKLESYDPVG